MTTEPTTLIVETSGDDECPHDFLGDTADIVYFISFAHSERYGADHPLAKAAAILKRRMGIKLGPLMNYADARTENAEEEAHLERLWQDAAPVAESASATAWAIENTLELRDLTTDLPELPERLRELAAIAAWAAERGGQVRMTYII